MGIFSTELTLEDMDIGLINNTIFIKIDKERNINNITYFLLIFIYFTQPGN